MKSAPAMLGFIFHASILALPQEADARALSPTTAWAISRCLLTTTAPMTTARCAAPSSSATGLRRRTRRRRYRIRSSPSFSIMSHEVPDKWRPYIKRGIEDWQKVFENAGFRNAIIARDAPTAQEDPNWDPEDVRYNVVRWTPSGRQNAMGPAVIDPRSGEVISSHAIFWHDVLRLVETWYFTQVWPLDPRAQKLPLPDDITGEMLRYVVSHEIGHALGLRHNFKGHSAYSVAQLRSREWTEKWGTSASIMDYARLNYVAQPGDNAYLLPKFGPYDYFAIEWGYKQFTQIAFVDGKRSRSR